MFKKVVSLALVLLSASSLTACAFGSSVDPSLPAAQEIIDAVIESMSDVRTYQFDNSMMMSSTGETGCESFEMTMDMTLVGAVDIENRQIEADISMGAEIPGQGYMDVGMEMYVIGDTAYTKMDFFELDPTWLKMEVTDEVWDEMSQMVEMIEPYVDLLEAAEVRVTGIDEVAGMDCYVLEVIPDIDQLWQLAMQQAEATDAEMPSLSEELLSDMFRDFSVRQWVSTETFFITRVMIDMSVELTPEDMGFPEEDGILVMDIIMYLLVHDYNQPVSIELPPGAESAVEAEAGF